MRKILQYLALNAAISLAFSIAVSLALLETLQLHAFLQTVARLFLLASANVFGVPLFFVWPMPWWAIYLTVLHWLDMLLIYHRLTESDGSPESW